MKIIYFISIVLLTISGNLLCAEVEKVEQNSNLKIKAVRSNERIVVDGNLDEKSYSMLTINR